jgi:hypothetical protein
MQFLKKVLNVILWPARTVVRAIIGVRNWGIGLWARVMTRYTNNWLRNYHIHITPKVKYTPRNERTTILTQLYKEQKFSDKKKVEPDVTTKQKVEAVKPKITEKKSAVELNLFGVTKTFARNRKTNLTSTTDDTNKPRP